MLSCGRQDPRLKYRWFRLKRCHSQMPNDLRQNSYASATPLWTEIIIPCCTEHVTIKFITDFIHFNNKYNNVGTKIDQINLVFGESLIAQHWEHLRSRLSSSIKLQQSWGWSVFSHEDRDMEVGSKSGRKGENTLYRRERGKTTEENENRLEMGDEVMYVLGCRAKFKYFKIQMHQFYVSNFSFLHSSHSHFLNWNEINLR